MEAEASSTDRPPSFLRQSLPAVVPMLLISTGYVDPGKWVVTVEGGARFGFDLMAFMLIFNFAAIFCQYISARIGVITGKNLAQICSDEYDTWTCMLLGIQTELSVIMLDLNMILGMAQGLNLIFGWDLFTCVFLTATGAVFHILLTVLLDVEKAKILAQFVAGFVLLSFILGLLINQPEIPFSMNGILTRLSGESSFVLMSLLGANLVPHNFYLHSSVVQWHQGLTSISKNALCHNHFWAILCVFSGLYLVNNMLMTTSANEFYSTGPVLLTFQDALSPMEQVLRGPIALLGFLLILFLANQTIALTWSLGGEVVVRGFLKLDIPGWLHYATIRVIAVLPALYCVWSSGAEGMYQLLIFTQVLVALQLPSFVIPLFRVATSRSIMGVHKISQFMELLALIIFIGMLGLNIVFVVEMIFSNSDWASDLRWNVGSGVSVSYLVLLTAAFTSLCLMLWLAATPLRSASVQLDAQTWNWDMPETLPNPPVVDEESYLTETRCREDASMRVEEPTQAVAKTLEYSDVSLPTFHPDLPESIMEPDPRVNAVRENHSITSASTSESEAVSTVVNEISDSRLEDTKIIKMERNTPIEKTMEVEGDLNAERDDDDGDSWEAEEPSRVVSASVPSSTSDGPASFRSVNGKSDEGGNSFGSLLRIEGLGRAARRQLAAVLDEFWGQLYDFHGQVTQEAKAKKIDLLLGVGVDSRPTSSLQKVDACGKDYSEYLVSVGGRASDTLMNSAPYDFSKQPRMQSNSESSYGLQRSSSSMRANPIQLLDAYVQNSSHNLLDSSERRYSSVRNLHSSEAWDYQPATIHGYQTASYLSRLGKDRNSYNLNGPVDLLSLQSHSIGNTNHRDSLAFALGKKLHSGSGVGQPPGFPNIAVSRNCQLQSERSYNDFCSSGSADNTVNSVNTKKYHSLPDISGYSIPQRAGYASAKNAPWDGSVGYGSFASRTCYDQSLYSDSGLRTGGHLAFDELSSSKVYNEALSSQLSSGFDSGSLWSRQPYEQFGVTEKIHNVAMEGVGNRPNAIIQETTSFVDIEQKLLQSVRLCIVKLLKLEGSDWLFRQNGGADEDLIDCVATREKFVYEIETREMNQVIHMGEAHYFPSDRKFGSSMKNNEAYSSSFLVSSVPNCGEGCIWRSDLIISFGVWCIHRILNLSLVESRPELWGKYTYVLNRLQGIIDPAFLKPRSPLAPCFCLQVPMTHQQKSSPRFSNGMLPPTAKPGRGKCTTVSTLLELIRDVELAIYSRKGRTGTAAGDVAFPKGKENLASVLKRYKRRLSNKPVGTNEGTGSRKIPTLALYNQ
ncbi:Ethylene-insensitive protein 2 [Spatholobus suberectus]|nr:Ethylene-insensitive protein 2 [Spatholobus suberectus]